MTRHLLCCAVCVASSLLPALLAADEPRSTIDLFNGQDLSAWTVTDCEVAVEDGSLVLKSGNGLVRSNQRYGDFILELDWKARQPSGYDSGVYIRADLPPQGRPWPARYQVNLREGEEGSLRPVQGAMVSGLAKPGDWNHFKLTVIGKTAELEVNGVHAWKYESLEPATGYVGLQAEVPMGGQFEFRNIRIIEVDHQSLFNGRDLSGWEGGGADASACWKVEDGLLLCTGERGPWLRSREQYDDFNLRLDYKLKPSGNSGVYVRVPRNGDHRGKEKNGGQPSGVEIQILDDTAERYGRLQPYQFCGSVYAIAPAKPGVARPAGEWNSMEINCHGPNYRVLINGTVVVDATAEQFPELLQRELKGYLGLQNHSEEVWFRNIRIGPPME
jgi:hypothetical protein